MIIKQHSFETYYLRNMSKEKEKIANVSKQMLRAVNKLMRTDRFSIAMGQIRRNSVINWVEVKSLSIDNEKLISCPFSTSNIVLKFIQWRNRHPENFSISFPHVIRVVRFC